MRSGNATTMGAEGTPAATNGNGSHRTLPERNGAGTPGDRPEGSRAGKGGEATGHDRLRQAAWRAGDEMCLALRDQRGATRKISDALRMPWGKQAARTAALVIIHALARTGAGREQLRSRTIRKWEHLVSRGSDERMVFTAPLALRLLKSLPGRESGKAMRIMREAASGALDTGLVGEVLQEAVPGRRALSAYHTTRAAAALMAHLAIPDEPNWGRSGETVQQHYRMADYSCGAGALLLAAARRVREILRSRGDDPAELHGAMVRRWTTAMDILPASVAVAAAELDALEENPGRPTDRVGAMALPYGPIPGSRDLRGRPGGAEGRGMRRIQLGALELLEPRQNRMRDLAPLGRVEGQNWETELRAGSQDLVIMNPPFARYHNQRELDRNIPNPARRSGPTSKLELARMEQRTRSIWKKIGAEAKDSPALAFAHLAHRMVRKQGSIALLLPVTAASNGRMGPGGSGGGWASFRRIIAQEYRDIRVVTIAGAREDYRSFSHSTGIAEMMLLARRKRGEEQPDGAAAFINLSVSPRGVDEAVQLASHVRQVLSELKGQGPGATLEIGSAEIGGAGGGTVTISRIPEDGAPWENVRVREPRMGGAVLAIREGRVGWNTGWDPGGGPNALPMTALGELAQVSSCLSRLSHGSKTPIIQGHNCRRQTTLEVSPDMTSDRPADEAGWLHISNNLRYNSQPLAACVTSQPALGGKGWPTVHLPDERARKALAVWLNTTMGLVIHWSCSNRTRSGIGYLSTDEAKRMPVLDVRLLDGGKLEGLEGIFDEARGISMMAASEARRDLVRTELDRRVLEVLGIPGDRAEELREIREAWCRETTVVGSKGGRAEPGAGGPDDAPEGRDGRERPPVRRMRPGDDHDRAGDPGGETAGGEPEGAAVRAPRQGPGIPGFPLLRLSSGRTRRR